MKSGVRESKRNRGPVLAGLLAQQGELSQGERLAFIRATYGETLGQVVSDDPPANNKTAALFYELTRARKGDSSAYDMHASSVGNEQVQRLMQSLSADPSDAGKLIEKALRVNTQAVQSFQKSGAREVLDTSQPRVEVLLSKAGVAISEALIEQRPEMQKKALERVVEACNAAFKLDKWNHDINVRRAEAYLLLDKPEYAKADLQLAKRSATRAGNKDVVRKIIHLERITMEMEMGHIDGKDYMGLATRNPSARASGLVARLEADHDFMRAKADYGVASSSEARPMSRAEAESSNASSIGFKSSEAMIRAAAKPMEARAVNTAEVSSPSLSQAAPPLAKAKLSPMRGGFWNQAKQPGAATCSAAASAAPPKASPEPFIGPLTSQEAAQQLMGSFADAGDVERWLAAVGLGYSAMKDVGGEDGKGATTAKQAASQELWKDIGTRDFADAAFSNSPPRPSASMASFSSAAKNSLANARGTQEVEGSTGPSSAGQAGLQADSGKPTVRPPPGQSVPASLAATMGNAQITSAAEGRAVPSSFMASVDALLHKDEEQDYHGQALTSEGWPDQVNTDAGQSFNAPDESSQQKVEWLARIAQLRYPGLNLELPGGCRPESGERQFPANLSGKPGMVCSRNLPPRPESAGALDSDEDDSDAEGAPIKEKADALAGRSSLWSDADNDFEDVYQATDLPEAHQDLLELLGREGFRDLDQLCIVLDPSELLDADDDDDEFQSPRQSVSSDTEPSVTDAYNPAHPEKRSEALRETVRRCRGRREDDTQELKSFPQPFRDTLSTDESKSESELESEHDEGPMLRDNMGPRETVLEEDLAQYDDEDLIQKQAFELYKLGNKEFFKQNYTGAAEFFASADDLYSHSVVLTCLAAAHFHAKDFQHAYDAASKAIDMDHLHGDAYWWRAQACLAAGNYDIAHHDLVCLLIIYGHDPRNYRKCKTAFYELQKLERTSGWRRCKREMHDAERKLEEEEQQKAAQQEAEKIVAGRQMDDVKSIDALRQAVHNALKLDNTEPGSLRHLQWLNANEDAGLIQGHQKRSAFNSDQAWLRQPAQAGGSKLLRAKLLGEGVASLS